MKGTFANICLMLFAAKETPCAIARRGRLREEFKYNSLR